VGLPGAWNFRSRRLFTVITWKNFHKQKILRKNLAM
jgi:hypothetical protein